MNVSGRPTTGSFWAPSKASAIFEIWSRAGLSPCILTISRSFPLYPRKRIHRQRVKPTNYRVYQNIQPTFAMSKEKRTLWQTLFPDRTRFSRTKFHPSTPSTPTQSLPPPQLQPGRRSKPRVPTSTAPTRKIRERFPQTEQQPLPDRLWAPPNPMHPQRVLPDPPVDYPTPRR